LCKLFIHNILFLIDFTEKEITSEMKRPKILTPVKNLGNENAEAYILPLDQLPGIHFTLSVCLSVRLSIHPFRASLSVFCLFVFLSVKNFGNQNVDAYTLPLEQLPGKYITLSVCLSIYLSIRLSIHPFRASLSVFCLSVFMSVKESKF
jgi:hypothetical protein